MARLKPPQFPDDRVFCARVGKFGCQNHRDIPQQHSVVAVHKL
jgi:hypothetical protein